MQTLSTTRKLRENFRLTDTQAETVIDAVKLIIGSHSWVYAFQLEKILHALAHELADYALHCALAEQEKRTKLTLED